MATSQKMREMAAEEVRNYRAAIEYLDSLHPITYEGLVKVVSLAGLNTSPQKLQQTWQTAQTTPGGMEAMRHAYRDAMEKAVQALEHFAGGPTG